MSALRTQPITPADIQGRRIRIPIDTKRIFPSERARIAIVLLESAMTVAYDPRLGPDKERSGVLYVGPVLDSLVRPNEVLIVESSGGVMTFTRIYGA